ncbi:hypothetical protein ASZ90_009649 [hydrocarbon metagenome]|uniref:Uncharacterized protein n=1 Tax=hydrocarbon metagenome TaxID=938273 RepID=A0A0W8FI98_9ZZZZ|nr:hypothetical protein [Methanomicrobiaceae archaeon]
MENGIGGREVARDIRAGMTQAKSARAILSITVDRPPESMVNP